jgi:signal transduction histidine kinase
MDGAPDGDGSVTLRRGRLTTTLVSKVEGSLALPRSRAISAVVLGVLAGVIAEGHLWERHPLLTIVNLLATSAFCVTGLLLLEDPEQRTTAWAVIAAGVTLPLGWLDQWEIGPFPLYSVVFGYLSDIFGAWVLLRYPNARLSAGHRRFCAALAGWLILGPALLTLISRPEWWGAPIRDTVLWPSAWPDEALFHQGQYVFDAGALLLAVTFVVLLAGRLRSSSRPDLVILLPVITAAMLAAIAAGAVVIIAALGHSSDELFVIEGVTQLTVPVGFLVSITQQRLVRMTHLVTRLDSAAPTAEVLRQLLRVSLRDPGLELVTWSAADQTYRTVQGHAADPEALAAGRRQREVTNRDGERLAILLTDDSAARDRSLLATATALTRLALENVQLSHRLLTADYESRQRFASDLHDGVQNKLCGLLVALSAAQKSANATTRASLDRVDLRVREALNELRDLTHDVYPQALARLGLRAAIEDAARHLDLPAEITTPAESLPAGIEKTLYFMICEALTNAFQHARASKVTVSVTCLGLMAEAVVADDGHGGADPLGSGLSRMRDRARAHGGSLEIESDPHSGTRLTMRIPCA